MLETPTEKGLKREPFKRISVQASINVLLLQIIWNHVGPLKNQKPVPLKNQVIPKNQNMKQIPKRNRKVTSDQDYEEDVTCDIQNRTEFRILVDICDR